MRSLASLRASLSSACAAAGPLPILLVADSPKLPGLSLELLGSSTIGVAAKGEGTGL